MSRREKIAIILFGDYIFDGRVQRCAEALADNYEVKVFVTTDYTNNYPETFRGIGIDFIPLRSKKLSKHPLVQVIKFVEYFYVTTIHIKKYNPDFIHCNDIFTILFGWIFNNSKIIIYDSHELWKDTQHMQAYNKMLFKILAFIEKLVIKKVDAVITVNDHIAEILKNDHKIKLPTVIRNIANYEQIEQTDIIREELGLQSIEKIVLFIGALTEGRGLHNVIKCCQFTQKNINVIFIGDGYLKEDLIFLRNSLDLQNKVHFIDSVQQDQVLNYVKSSDLGIVPYENTCLNHYYCLPNKFFQYVEMGKPIVVSNFPELEEKVNKYHLGFTFDPNNPEDIASSINKVFANDFNLKEENVTSFLNDYNWNNERKKLLDLYNSITDVKV